MKMIDLIRSVTAALLLSCGAAALAWPDRPVTLVVPYAPGGSTDIAARLVAQGMSKDLNVAVIVRNQPGASGNIGTAAVARAAGDGYTLLFAGNGIASAPSMKEVSFDLKRDLTPISRVVSSQFSILVNPNLKVNTLKEFIDYARANPGKLNMACSGLLTAAHFSLESFRQAAGIEFTTIQFNGNAPAALAMMSGDTPAGIDAAFSAKSAVAAGRLRALAVTGSKRSPALPDVPTVAEAAIPGFSEGFSLVMMAPSSTPRAVIDRVHRSIVNTLKDPAVAEKLEAQGFDLVGNSPEEYAAELEANIKINAKIIADLRAAGVIQ